MDCNGQITFLDLPENVFRKIFRYFEDKTVYITFRNLCKKIKVYVDAYVQLGGIFVIPSRNKVPYLIRPFIFYVLKQRCKVLSVYCKSSYPAYVDLYPCIPTHEIGGPGSFSFVLEDKLIVGNVFVRTSTNILHEIQPFGKRQRKIECGFNEYDLKRNIWVSFSVEYESTFVQDLFGVFPFNRYKQQGKIVDVCSCSIGEGKLILLFNESEHHSLCSSKGFTMQTSYWNQEKRLSNLASFV